MLLYNITASQSIPWKNPSDSIQLFQKVPDIEQWGQNLKDDVAKAVDRLQNVDYLTEHHIVSLQKLIERAATMNNGHIILKKLAKITAIVQSVNKNGLTIFEQNVISENTQHAQMLHKAGFVFFLKKRKQNSLHFFARTGVLSAIEKLCPYARFCDLSHKDRFGFTPFEVALHKKHEKIALCLLPKKNLSKLFPLEESRFQIALKAMRQNMPKLLNRLTEYQDMPKSDTEGKTLFFYAQQENHTQAMTFLMKKYGSDIFSPKHLSQSFRLEILDQIGGKKRSAPSITKYVYGSLEEKMYPILSWMWGDFARSHTHDANVNRAQKMITTTQEVLLSALGNTDAAMLAKKVQKITDPILVIGGSDSHSIALVFSKNRLFICNRGNSLSTIAWTKNPIVAFHIDPKKITTRAVKILLAATNLGNDDAFPALYVTFIQAISAKRDKSLTKKITKLCPISSQTHSNCVVTSSKVGALAIGISYALNEKDSTALIEQSFDVYKKFSRWSKEKAETLYRLQE